MEQEKEKENSYKEKLIKNDTIEIDGSILEGGGQILRISTCLAVLFNKQLKIEKIRNGRCNPGIQNLHMICFDSLKTLFKKIEINGVSLNSTNIIMNPNENELIINQEEKDIKIKLKGACSIALLIQQMLPIFLFTKNIEKYNIFMYGGTIGKFAPSIIYLNTVLYPILNKMNINANCKTYFEGLFPIGGGKIQFFIKELKEPINNINILERGKLISAEIRCCSTNNFSFNSDKLHKEILKSVKRFIRREWEDSGNENDFDNEKLNIQFIDLPNSYLTFFYQVVLKYENTIISNDFVYSSKREEKQIYNNILDEVVSKTKIIIENRKACFDEFTVDHLIIFMTLAKGISKIAVGKISLHTETAIEIVKKFIPDINIKITPINPDEKDDDLKGNYIEIEGIGYI